MNNVEITDIGIYDNSKPLDEQTQEVQDYIFEFMQNADTLETPLKVRGLNHAFLKSSVLYQNAYYKFIQTNFYSPEFGHRDFASNVTHSYQFSII